MSQVPSELRYAASHEWVRVEKGVATIGITDHAQSALTDIVYVELPKVGAAVKAGGEFGVVESIKSVSDLYAPVSGTVVEVNSRLANAPELVNQSPFGDGWMIRVRVSAQKELAALLTADGYRKSLASA